MKKLLFVCILLTSFFSFGQEMRIGLLRSIKVKSCSVNTISGGYSLFGDTINLGTANEVSFVLQGDKIRVQYNGRSEVYKRVLFLGDSLNASFSIKSQSPSSRLHKYQNSLEITSETNRIRIVNLVDMNNYLAGVIESEGGGGKNLEYYKVQALMSRTYILKNQHRHNKEGFQVCDGVHCQAYHNMLRYTPIIRKAVDQTTGKVLVDENNRMVTSYFSANCGGQTCDASFVWNSSVPFLESFIDTFCIHTRQANWTKSIDKNAWEDFLKKEYDVTEEKYGDLIYNFHQEERKAFFIHPSLGVPLRDLRKKFKLKSTYFDSQLIDEKVVLKGRGFGHGVGLCQEGAMGMANAGYDYEQIALFYFENVRVIDYYRDLFFKQEEGMTLEEQNP